MTSYNILSDSEGVKRALFGGSTTGTLLKHREPVAPYGLNFNAHARVNSGSLVLLLI